jgi:hypothetical protein
MEAKIESEIKTIQEKWTPIKKGWATGKSRWVGSLATRIDANQEISCTRNVRGITQHYKRATHGGINEGLL